MAEPRSQAREAPARFSASGIASRLFLTCWLVYTLHFATDIVRETYLALAIGDHFTFRVDEYAHLHPDLFEKPGYGWHIGNNPGGSMVAAIPYALARPIIDGIVERVNRGRETNDLMEPPAYDTPRLNAQKFFQEAWRRGLDVKLGLAAFVMQCLAMAPSSALGVVVMFYLLRILFGSDRTALGLSLLYAFGTPVFFRTGFLNHNLMLGHIAFMGFAALWNPSGGKLSSAARFLLGGLAGGTAVLFDYSGIVLLAGLFLYGIAKQYRDSSAARALRHGAWYVLGTLPAILLLWLYQWRSFGHPFYPGQHWMPPVEWIDRGYQGYGLPQPELLLTLAFDYRYGLFVCCPLLLLAFVAPFVDRGPRHRLPPEELWFLLLLFLAFWLFFSGSNYTRLQFNTGIRYMTPILPFLFIPAAAVLMRLPSPAIYVVSLLSFVISWPLAMYRDVARGPGILNPILHVLVGGLQLPALNTLSSIGSTAYGTFFAHGVSALPLFLLTGAILYGIWSPRWSRLSPSE